MRSLVGVALLALLAACRGDGRTPLVIYSPHGRDLLTLLERRFEDLHPDVDVRWLDMGSQEVYERLRSEQANPQADVWFGGPATIFARAAEDSLLASFRPTWAAAIAPHGRGPGDRYAAAYETPAVIVYAEQAIRPEEAPQDWDDLLDPRWKGKILIRDPLASGTMRAVWGMIIERGLKQTGDTAAGFRWLARLDAQTKEYVLNGPLLDQKIVRQEGLVTIWDLPDILLSRRDGLRLGYVFPRSGTPVIEDAIGVVRGARHGDQARAFVEFVGSVDAQLLAAREAYRLPARLDLPVDSLPPWAREVRRTMKVADVDWDLLARRGPEWMRHWDEAVRRRNR
jgi:iron(III) transport system substrate-binding protein